MRRRPSSSLLRSSLPVLGLGLALGAAPLGATGEEPGEAPAAEAPGSAEDGDAPPAARDPSPHVRETARPDPNTTLSVLAELATHGRNDEAIALAARPGVIDFVDADGHTALFAATLGGPELVATIVSLGADPDHRDDRGATALHFAAIIGNAGAARALVAAGADLHAAERELGMTPLHAAAQNGNTGVVTVLVLEGAEVDRRDRFGATALGYAAAEGHVEVARILLGVGADPNLGPERDEVRPLALALLGGHGAVAELIEAHGGR